MIAWLVLASQLSLADEPSAGSDPAPDTPPAPPSVAIPTDPGAAPSPYADRMPAILLAGRSTELDLERLARVQLTFTMEVDMSPIAAVDAAKASGLLRHLAADPRWRVVEQDGALVAFERTGHGKEQALLSSGVQEGPREIYATALRFGPRTPDSPWNVSEYVSHADPKLPSLDVRTFLLEPEPYGGWTATAISIEGPDVALEIYEARFGKGRPRSAESLSTVLPLVEGITADVARIDRDGYHRWHLPAKEPTKNREAATLNSPGPGLLDLRGRVNPGAAGWTWARVLDGDLAPWEEAAVAAGTRERVGWSPLPTEQFFLQGTFPVPRGKAFSGTVEFWFQADSGGPPVRLEAVPVTIPRR